MSKHSILPMLEDIEGFKRDPNNPQPLPTSLLRDVQFIPAPEPARGPVRFRTSQTFYVHSRTTPKITTSSLAKGAWEVDGDIVDWGLPGREIINVKATKKTKGKRKNRAERLEGFIPTSAPISVHPQAYCDESPSKMSRSEDGRLHVLDNNTTQIFGRDDRVPTYPNSYPHWCICELKFWTRVSNSAPWVTAGRATGFMAGRSVCVTASHVFPKPPFAGWKVDVVPGSFGGPSILGPGAITNAHSALWGPADTAGDLMVLGLYDPIGERTGWFGTSFFTDSWKGESWWLLQGYPWDFAPYPSFQGGIAIDSVHFGPNVALPNGDWWESLQLESIADTASGLSGAPLFRWFDDGMPYVVGVHGRHNTDASFASGGRLLVAMVGWARGAWK